MLKKNKGFKVIYLSIICIFILCIIYLSLYVYFQYRINSFLDNQQTWFKQNHLLLSSSKNPSKIWSIFPQQTIISPVIKYIPQQHATSTLEWQTKQIKISYNLLHPLSISVTIDGEQTACLSSRHQSCYQIHGESWQLYFPVYKPLSNNNIQIICPDIFYQNNNSNSIDIRALHVQGLQAKLGWNIQNDQHPKIIFTTIYIKKISIFVVNNLSQTLNDIQMRIGLIHNNENTKILVQQLHTYWQSLSTNLTGQITLSVPQLLPMGELSFHISNIIQAIHQQVSKLECCEKLKQDLMQLHIPDQITLPFSIRNQDIYVGNIPINDFFNQNILSTIKKFYQYKKDHH